MRGQQLADLIHILRILDPQQDKGQVARNPKGPQPRLRPGAGDNPV